MPEKNRKTIFAVIDARRHRRLFHRLIDDGLTYSAWLQQRIDEYTQAKDPKRAQRKGV